MRLFKPLRMVGLQDADFVDVSSATKTKRVYNASTHERRSHESPPSQRLQLLLLHPLPLYSSHDTIQFAYCLSDCCCGQSCICSRDDVFSCSLFPRCKYNLCIFCDVCSGGRGTLLTCGDISENPGPTTLSPDNRNNSNMSRNDFREQRREYTTNIFSSGFADVSAAMKRSVLRTLMAASPSGYDNFDFDLFCPDPGDDCLLQCAAECYGTSFGCDHPTQWGALCAAIVAQGRETPACLLYQLFLPSDVRCTAAE